MKNTCDHAARSFHGFTGYRQQQFMNGKGYYEEDLDTDEYARRHQMRYKSYSDGIAGGHGDRDDDSDWSEDEQVCTLYMLPCFGINSHFY